MRKSIQNQPKHQESKWKAKRQNLEWPWPGALMGNKNQTIKGWKIHSTGRTIDQRSQHRKTETGQIPGSEEDLMIRSFSQEKHGDTLKRWEAVEPSNLFEGSTCALSLQANKSSFGFLADRTPLIINIKLLQVLLLFISCFYNYDKIKRNT